MSVALRVIITSRLNDGAADKYRELGDRLSRKVAEHEPGTTVYNWWMGEDGTVINEDGFIDEAAFGLHMANMTESGDLDDFLGLMEIQSVVALGEVSDATRQAMAAFGAAHYSRIFER